MSVEITNKKTGEKREGNLNELFDEGISTKKDYCAVCGHHIFQHMHTKDKKDRLCDNRMCLADVFVNGKRYKCGCWKFYEEKPKMIAIPAGEKK